MTKPRPRAHVLICVGGEEFSEDTIRFGARTAEALEADVSVLYVGLETARSLSPEVTLARDKLSEWEIDHPGVRVLRYARDVIADEGLAARDRNGEVVKRHSLRPGIGGAYELHLVGSYGEEVRLRLREGSIIEQIVSELDSHHYSVVVLGAPQRRRLLHEIVQFANASVLIAKNAQREYYDLLLPVDDSEAARRARHMASLVAHALHLRVLVLSIAESAAQLDEAQALAEREAGIVARRGIEAQARSAVGDVVEEISKAAGDDHIIVLGASRRRHVWQYLFGSTPITVVQRAESPVLVVKEIEEFPV
ncbi:MAG: universal stress protein [Armatimonadota bacterium]|jgi:nucleotide-binding universal stress UspA family protein